MEKRMMDFPWRSKMFGILLAALVSVSGAFADTSVDARDDVESPSLPGQTAPRLQNLGNHVFPVTTNSARAQLFINQGLMLAYGFNHAEAARAFGEAARLDPNCAMAYWGQALVLGPNINMPMPREAEPQAYAMIQKAISLKDKVSEKEQAYIEALATRYAADPAPDRPALDRAYAEAMDELSARFPDDLDAATLHAEALMDLSPWDYWSRDMQPHPRTETLLTLLESVLERNAHHPGAIHLYIHAVELGRPELAETGAERLWRLAPGAGHLVHMPSHIFRRIGRYTDASQSNVDAIAADEDYIVQCRAQGVYPLAYYPHNIHFLWDSATMEGRRQTAIDAAEKSAARIPEGAWRELPMLHQFLVAPLQAYTRFGEWDRILALPRPPAESPFWNGLWHYARGLALTAKGELDAAAGEQERLETIAAMDALADLRVTFSRNGAGSILDIAVEVLAGELAAARGDFGQAIARLHRGVLMEENLIYNEPPDWHVPVRQTLGAVLLEAGRAAEAEAVYWQDLSWNRENGWSLYGLEQSLRDQGKVDQADGVALRFRKAWERADVSLTASRFMDRPGPALAEVSTGR